MHNRIPSAQLYAWLLVAAVPAILSTAGRTGWFTVSLTAVVCVILSICILACNKRELPRWLCVLELLWLTVLLGGVAVFSATCWTEVDTPSWIPVILLAVAALAAKNGGVRAGRTGAVLNWFVLPVLAIVFLAGTTDRDWAWVRKEMEVPDGSLITWLLLPCLSIFLPQEKSKKRYALCAVLGAVAMVGSIIMDAVLGVEVAQSSSNSFYEFSKGVTLFGVAERFEAVVACALTGGWFALFVIILSAVHHLAEKIFAFGAKWSVWICAIIAAGLMCMLPNRADWMAVGCLIFWGFLPVAAQGVESRKNIEKK